jgi:hypothetical protein
MDSNDILQNMLTGVASISSDFARSSSVKMFWAGRSAMTGAWVSAPAVTLPSFSLKTTFTPSSDSTFSKRGFGNDGELTVLKVLSHSSVIYFQVYTKAIQGVQRARKGRMFEDYLLRIEASPTPLSSRTLGVLSVPALTITVFAFCESV